MNCQTIQCVATFDAEAHEFALKVNGENPSSKSDLNREPGTIGKAM